MILVIRKSEVKYNNHCNVLFGFNVQVPGAMRV